MHEPESIGLTIFKLFAILFLVGLNGFFVAAEFAIVKVRGTRIQSLARKGSRRARLSQHIIDRLDAYLSATQLGITIASILLGWVGEETVRTVIVGPVLHSLSVTNEVVIRVTSFVFGTGVIVFLHVVLGELAPKNLAIQRPEPTALWVAYPMHWFYVLLYPAIVTLNSSANFFLRLAGIHPSEANEMAHSEEELRMIFAESQKSGVLTSEKRDLLENVFDLSRRIVRQIMVPRTEIAAFNLSKSLAENLMVAEQTAHSRYPLVDGDLDHVVGVIHMKDLFWQLKDMEEPPEDVEKAMAIRNPMIAGGNVAAQPPASGAGFLRTIAREVPYVPETMRIDNLLREFQQQRVHLAMVVDEYGGTSGMVTFENVIEEIVGEVQDEFDHEMPMIRKTAEDEYVVDGAMLLTDLNDEIGTSLSAEDIDTIGGLLFSEFGRIPKIGESVAIDGVLLTVGEVRSQRINRVIVQPERSAMGTTE
jgi:CBS domain containing-hemolysin-like protein